MSVYPTIHPTPRPWSCEGFETEGGNGKYTAYALFNVDGKTICDTMNGGLQTEYVEYGDEDGVSYVWDEQGRVDMEYAAKAINAYEDAITALQEIVRVHDKPIPIDQHSDPEKLLVIMQVMADFARAALIRLET